MWTGALLTTIMLAGEPSTAVLDQQVDLQWEAPHACADGELVRTRLREYLAHADPSPQEHVVARVSVRADAEQLVATLELTTTQGESRRTLSASRCEEIADAVALVVATTLDPLLELRGDSGVHERDPITSLRIEPELPEPEPEPEPDALPEPEPPISVPTPALSRDDEAAPPPDRPQGVDRPISVLAMVGAGVRGGLLPSPGAQLELVLGVQWRWLRAVVLGSYAFAREHAVTGVPDVAITLRHWSLGGLGCGVPAFGRLELPVCVGVEGGTMLGDGQGDALQPRRSAARPWLGIVARAGLHVRVTPRFGIARDLHGDAVALRPAFHLEGPDGPIHAYTASRVAGRAILGLEVRWP